MSVKRFAAKRDKVEKAIVKALRDAGAAVVMLSETGVPDLLVSLPDGSGQNYLMECKDPEIGRLKPAQVEFFNQWPGQKCIVTSPEEALAVIGK